MPPPPLVLESTIHFDQRLQREQSVVFPIEEHREVSQMEAAVKAMSYA